MRKCKPLNGLLAFVQSDDNMHLSPFLHDDQGMSTDMFGCYQKFGPQQIRYYLIAVWVNIDVDVEAERFVFRKGRIVTV